MRGRKGELSCGYGNTNLLNGAPRKRGVYFIYNSFERPTAASTFVFVYVCVCVCTCVYSALIKSNFVEVQCSLTGRHSN